MVGENTTGTANAAAATTSSSKPPVDFKSEYVVLETNLEYGYGHEKEAVMSSDILTTNLGKIMAGESLGSDEHTTYFLMSALPKLTKKLLKQRFFQDEGVAANLIGLFQKTFDALLWAIQTEHPVATASLLELLPSFFDKDALFYLCKKPKPTPAAAATPTDAAQTASPTTPSAEQPAQVPSSQEKEPDTPAAPAEPAPIPWGVVFQSFGSEILADLVTYFCTRGGITSVLRHIEKCSLLEVMFCCDALCALMNSRHLSNARFADIGEGIRLSAVLRLIRVNQDELKQMRKEDMDKLFQRITSILESAFPLHVAAEILEPVYLDVALKCFQSKVFDKRNYGITSISNMISWIWNAESHAGGISQESSASSTTATSTAVVATCAPPPTTPKTSVSSSTFFRMARFFDRARMVKWVCENKVLEDLLLRETHVELIKKSSDLLRFMAKSNALTNEHIDTIWETATREHESISHALLKIIGEDSGSFCTEHIERLISHITKFPRASLTTQHVTLIREISTRGGEAEHKALLLDFLWSLVLDSSESSPPVEIAQSSLTSLCDTVRLLTFAPQRETWLERVLRDMKEIASKDIHTPIIYCYGLLETLIQSYPARATDSEKSATHIATQLEGTHQLTQFIFKELISLHKLGPSAVRQAYITEIESRLNFLQNFLNRTGDEVNIEDLTALWDNIVEDPISGHPEEADSVLRWFCTARAGKNINTKSAEAIFKNMLKPSFALQAGKSEQALRCFCNTFLDVNTQWIKNWNWTDDSKLEVATSAADLYGYDQIWSIILDAAVQDVSRQCISFLHKLHSSVSPSIRADLGEGVLRLSFIDNCIKSLNSAVSEGRRGAILRCLDILGQYIGVPNAPPPSTPKGTTPAPQQTTEPKEKPAEAPTTKGLPILVSVKLAPTKATFDIMTHTKAPISSLRTEIVKRLEQDTARAYNLQEISLRAGGLAIADEQKPVGSLRKGSVILVNVPLRYPEQETFNRTRRYVTAVAVPQNTATATTPAGTATSSSSSGSKLEYRPSDAEENAKQLVQMFNCSMPIAYAALRKSYWLLDTAAGMILDGTNMDVLQALAEKEEELDNSILNSKANATKVPELVGAFETAGPPEAMPGPLISANEPFFSAIIDLLDKFPADSEITAVTWDLLKRLPTSSDIGDSLNNLDRPIEVILDIKSPSKLLYSLRIIDSLLFGEMAETEHRNPVQWVQQFNSRHGVTHLIKTAEVLLQSLPGSSDFGQLPGDPVTLAVDCITLSLKIVAFITSVTLIPAAILGDISSSLLSIAISIIQDHPSPVLTEAVSFCTTTISNSLSGNQTAFRRQFSDLNTLTKLLESLISAPSVPGLTHTFVDGLINLFKLDMTREIFSAVLGFFVTRLPDATTTPEATLASSLLLPLVVEMVPSSDSQRLKELAKRLFQTLCERPVFENRSGLVDNWLVGMMKTLCICLRRLPEIHKDLTASSLNCSPVFEIYYNCLFAIGGMKKDGDQKNSIPLPKCKTSESRVTAMELLVELCRQSTENFLELLQFLNSQHSPPPAQAGPSDSKAATPTGMTKISGWDYHPESDSRSETGYVGLTNVGNTCYMNSLLQQLYMMRGVVPALLEVDPATCPTGGELVRELQTLFAYMRETERKAANTASFCAAYRKADGGWHVHGQQDVDEFFNFLWQKLEQDLKGTPQWERLSKVFVGQSVSEIMSADKDRPYESERTEDFNTIPIDVKGKRTIEEGLDLFVAPDKLEDFKADGYAQPLNVKKRTCIKRLPNTLILHLKRFDYDFATNQRKKINDFCSFPTRLNMKPWTQEGLREREGRVSSDPNADKRPESYYDYTLAGVIVHSGGGEAGHYYSYIKERGGSGKWFEFNDPAVSSFNPNDLTAEAFGGKQMVSHWDNWQQKHVKQEYERVRNAYMLIYERTSCETEPVQPVVVPEALLQRVSEENSTIIRDRQCFDDTYFNFLLDFASLSPGGRTDPVMDLSIPQEQLEADPIFKKIKLCTNFFLDVLVHAKQASPILAPWANQLKADLNNNAPAAKWFLLNLLERNLLKELLLDCSVETTRIIVADLISAVLSGVSLHENDIMSILLDEETNPFEQTTSTPPSPLYQTCTTVRFMDGVLGLLEDSRSAWKRFKQYFKVIQDFAENGMLERRFLIQRDIFNLYSDYFMGRPKKHLARRVSVMDEQNLPDLREFIRTLAVLYRGCYQGPTDDQKTPLSLPGQLIKPSNTHVKLPLFTNPFFQSMLEMDYNSPASQEIVVHASWNDAARTKQILEEVLKSMMEGDTDKLHVWHGFLRALLSMEDPIQAWRVQTALGSSAISGQPHATGHYTNYAAPVRGLLGIMQDQKSRTPHMIYLHIKFLLDLNERIPAVREYLFRNRRDISWIDSFVESKVSNRFSMEMLTPVLEDALMTPEERELGGPALNETQVRMRSDSNVATLISVKSLAKAHAAEAVAAGESPNGSSSVFDKEREAQLLQEIDGLREALLYYAYSPEALRMGLKPHPFLYTTEWTLFMRKRSEISNQGMLNPKSATADSTSPATGTAGSSAGVSPSHTEEESELAEMGVNSMMKGRPQQIWPPEIADPYHGRERFIGGMIGGDIDPSDADTDDDEEMHTMGIKQNPSPDVVVPDQNTTAAGSSKPSTASSTPATVGGSAAAATTPTTGAQSGGGGAGVGMHQKTPSDSSTVVHPQPAGTTAQSQLDLQRAESVKQVMEFTGCDELKAREALAQNFWNVEDAAGAVLQFS